MERRKSVRSRKTIPSVEFDEDFTPQSPKKWTKERLDIKLNNLAKIISKMNDGRGPDVLGLCEVENRKVVEMLVAKLAPLGRKYEIVHQDSPSDRGIDTALIYDANVFELADSKFHFVDAEKTRDIIEAKLKRVGAGDDAAALYVFVNHWPSRNNDEWQRIMAATVLRKRLDEILAADPKADFVLVGDFNDEPDNVSIAKFLRAAKTPKSPAGRHALRHHGPDRRRGEGHVRLRRQVESDRPRHRFARALGRRGLPLEDRQQPAARIPGAVLPSALAGCDPRPSKSYSENDFHKDGYSDHLAVVCIISD